ncbi:sialate O-acetylesterase [Rariglobus hedericola]|uniref:Sialate O-acetylesterase n=1 Tax=Rariglobus hedericola TaxID=2597822 RepID=A0A556QL21_9BACT|nr:sialate O-acetylesterase [Rariglobus hedericola]TSJ77343.1 sialate O-acetylesterase [Rariglobus hedericola]
MRLPRFLALLAVPAALTSTAFADVTLPAIFSDHAVLQKSAKVPVWGRGEPGEKISVTLGSAKASATTGDTGRWEAMLDLSRSGPGPFSLVVQGKNTLTIADVVVGEVWLASGQSNMEWTLKSTNNAAAEIAASANPLLRIFTVTKNESATPITGFNGKWVLASPETSAGLTAVGYYFGKNVQRALKAPVGVIHSSWGGTPVETWTSKEALDSDPELKAGAEKAESDLRTYSRRLRTYVLGYPDWLETTGRKDHPYSGVPSSADGWKPAVIPGKLGAPGAIWLRRTVQVSPEQAGKNLSISLSEWQRGTDEVYWNGTLVSSTSLEQAAKTRGDRRHTIPAAQVTAGEAVIAIRIFNASGDVHVPAAINLGKLQAGAGGWEQKTEFALPALSEAEKATMPVNPGSEPWSWQGPSRLYNSMIHPLIPYALKGVVWYQGESNVGRAYQYRTAFPLLIKDWRTRWGQGDFPFLFCQLANMTGKQPMPGDANWAELRESQSLTLAVANTGQAVLIDVGDANNVHPQNKADVGARLAAIALAQTYGQSVPFSGPVFQAAKIDGGKIRLAFKQTDGGLVAKALPATYSVDSATGATAPIVRNNPGALEGFAICGADRKWVWAEAKIEGNQVIVSSAQVTAPVAVRYAWAGNPTCNLYNGAGFPASPFRTDDFPITSQTTRY